MIRWVKNNFLALIIIGMLFLQIMLTLDMGSRLHENDYILSNQLVVITKLISKFIIS